MRHYVLIFFLIAFLGEDAISQISLKGQPYSLLMSKGNVSEGFVSNVVLLRSIDNLALQAEAIEAQNTCDKCGEYYSKGIKVKWDIKKQGKIHRVEKGRVWMLKVESLDAYGMQFYFNKYHLPKKSSLFIYNEDQSVILGAFTHINNHIDQKFATESLPGKAIYIEYFESDDNDFEGELQIDHVGYVFKDIYSELESRGDIALPCTIDINCQQGSNYQDIKKAVCRISIFDRDGFGAYYASGFLINNLESTRKPYVLTAWHVQRNQFNLLDRFSDWIFEFNYEAISCNSNIKATNRQSHQGAIPITGDIPISHAPNGLDYLLLDLQTTAIENWLDVSYLGWDIRAITPNKTFSLHHPNGDVKKISIDNNQPVAVNTYVGIDAISEQNIAPRNDWRVSWEEGITMGGSSGSPLIDQGSQLAVGHFRGGASNCDASGTNVIPGPDYYVKISSAWTGYYTSLFYYPLGKYLDPYYSGTTILANYIPRPTQTPGTPVDGSGLPLEVGIYPGVTLSPTYKLGGFENSQTGVDCSIQNWIISSGRSSVVNIPLTHGGGKMIRMHAGGYLDYYKPEIAKRFDFVEGKEYVLTLRVYVGAMGDEMRVILKNSVNQQNQLLPPCGSGYSTLPNSSQNQTLMILDRDKITDHPNGPRNFATYAIKFLPVNDYDYVTVQFKATGLDEYDPSGSKMSYGYIDEIYLFEQGDYVSPQHYDNVAYYSSIRGDNCANTSITVQELYNEEKPIVIESGREVSLTSKAIYLKEGFHAKEGSSFRAAIEDCIKETASNEPVGPLEYNIRSQLVSYSSSTAKMVMDLDNFGDYEDYENIYRGDVDEDDQLESHSKMTIYPNPSFGNFNVRVLTGDKDVQSVLYDARGKVIEIFTQTEFEIDISAYPDGMYFLKTVISGVNEVRKIVKIQFQK